MLPKDPSKHEEYITKLKNKIFTDTHRQNLSVALIGNQRAKGKKWSKPSSKKGSKLSEMTKSRISQSKVGKKHTKETKMKMSLSHLGKTTWNKGLPQSDETKQKISIAKKNPSEETRFRLGNGMRGKKRPSFSLEWRNKISQARQHRVFPTKDSKPEKMMQIALTLNGIMFETHKSIIGQPDIFIYPNICIFIDGDFWHANPDKYKADQYMFYGKCAKDIWANDIRITNELSKLGHSVIRLWESDIKNNTQNCAEKIIAHLKTINGVEKLAS